MKNLVSQTVKSWNRFSDSVPRKRAGGRSFGDKSRNGVLVVKSVGVSMQSVCVALQSVAAQNASVLGVCE
jgi:phosphoribosylformylglycinamidine (FGAM) synthase-like amidotransferase family enzyme